MDWDIYGRLLPYYLLNLLVKKRVDISKQPVEPFRQLL